ncbi:MAG: beta-(1-6) glucans synthase [Alphaproteobacteria bacterium]|nr:beta-(1-6) glucans synthase [Alphaproteobacteria bacterium]
MLVPAPIDPDYRLQCVSYAPFRGRESPLVESTHVDAAQIEQDLRRLHEVTDCIRTYSIENGLDQVPEIATKVGLKVIQGVWIGSNRDKNRAQIATAVRLTRDFPKTITALVVGNEVLLRGEMTASDLAAIIRQVKAQVKVRVTYADVWEFWLRNREISDAVDFVTIHILPYWEDIPVRAKLAAAHVNAIRQRMAVAFPGKEILIGETGWPSHGRMREGALPSRTNQARVVSEILSLARAQNFRVNLIEAYDQPWKRRIEGTVGGYWGLFDSVQRELKYPAGVPISNFPAWKWYLGLGLGFCTLVFLVAGLSQRRKSLKPRPSVWLGIGIAATSAGILLGVAFDKMYYESLGRFGWLQWGALFVMGLLSPLLVSRALVSGQSLPTFLDLMGPRQSRSHSALAILLGLTLAVTVVIAAQMALGLVFDPRYRDFPFASLTMAVVPFAMLLANRPSGGVRPIAEALFAALFVLSSAFIVVNEGRSNWQSLWSCAVFVLLAFTLWRARVGQNPADLPVS